jgi:hypothetical protein
LRRAPAALAGDYLIPIAVPANDDRLDNAIRADGSGQFLKILLRESLSGLLGIGIDKTDVYFGTCLGRSRIGLIFTKQGT